MSHNHASSCVLEGSSRTSVGGGGGSGSGVSSAQDVALWLHNKLGSSDANWCSSQLASQLSVNNLAYIPQAFANLSPQVKYRLLMSFLFIPKRQLQAGTHLNQ